MHKRRLTLGSNNGNSTHLFSFYRQVTINGSNNIVRLSSRIGFFLLIIAIVIGLAHCKKTKGCNALHDAFKDRADGL